MTLPHCELQRPPPPPPPPPSPLRDCPSKGSSFLSALWTTATVECTPPPPATPTHTPGCLSKDPAPLLLPLPPTPHTPDCLSKDPAPLLPPTPSPPPPHTHLTASRRRPCPHCRLQQQLSDPRPSPSAYLPPPTPNQDCLSKGNLSPL